MHSAQQLSRRPLPNSTSTKACSCEVGRPQRVRMVADYGYENDTHWLVVAGACGFVVDGDIMFTYVPGDSPLVESRRARSLCVTAARRLLLPRDADAGRRVPEA